MVNIDMPWGMDPHSIQRLIQREMQRELRKQMRDAVFGGVKRIAAGLKSTYQSGTGSTAMVPYNPNQQKLHGRHWNWKTGAKGLIPKWIGTPYTRDDMKYEDWYKAYYANKKAKSGKISKIFSGAKYNGLSRKDTSGSRFKGLSRKRNY